MDKVKKIAKYTTNILGFISMLVVGFSKIEGITIPYAHIIIEGIAVVQGAIGFYLLGNKTFNVKETKQELLKGDEENGL